MEVADLPESHPRYQSLVTRHRIEAGLEAGITSPQGLIAQGRGEAFDYLLGEETLPSADEASRAAAAHLLLADHPTISVNGNVAALTPDAVVELANLVDADIEVNLFNRTEDRIEAIIAHLNDHGASDVKGATAEASIPGLDHERARVDADGLYTADTVLVPLEDGDRTAALRDMGKVVIVIDLNPLSRSAQAATVPIVDNLVRAMPNLISHATDLSKANRETWESIVSSFDSEEALDAAEQRLRTDNRQ